MFDLSNPQDSGRINPTPTPNTNTGNIKIKSESVSYTPLKK